MIHFSLITPIYKIANQRLVIILICLSQWVYIFPPLLTLSVYISCCPNYRFNTKTFVPHTIRKYTCMSSIAIWKRMYLDKLMMNSCWKLPWFIMVKFNPALYIFKQVVKIHPDLTRITPNIFFGSTKVTCPTPYPAEHFFMQGSSKIKRQYLI